MKELAVILRGCLMSQTLETRWFHQMSLFRAMHPLFSAWTSNQRWTQRGLRVLSAESSISRNGDRMLKLPVCSALSSGFHLSH